MILCYNLSGDYMKREDIKSLLVCAIGIALIILAVKFFIALLPVIIVALLCLLIYDSYKKQKGSNSIQKKEKKVREAEILEEKNID